MERLTDNLVRAYQAGDAVRAKADEQAGDGNTLYGHFSVFNTWYEVNSAWEGQFLERIAPGAFARTIAERGDQIKALYDHGHDPQIGNKPLGAFRELREDETGGYYEIGLIDTPYNREFIKPAAAAGLLGASFRFRVRAESWVEEPKVSASNPKGLPERTITDTDLYELGPVTFPASAAATAGLRSQTDMFFDRLLDDPVFVARFAERTSARAASHLLAQATHGAPASRLSDAPHGSRNGTTGRDPAVALSIVEAMRLATPKGTR